MDELARLLRDQDGVIRRAQALEAGMSPAAIDRAVRRRGWVAVHPEVYVEQAGPHPCPLTWQRRAWAAVLACWPAALYAESARRAHEGPGRRGCEESVIHVAVDRSRRDVAEPPWVRVHRVARLDERVVWDLSPPRPGYADTLLDLAAARHDAPSYLVDVCGGRRTQAAWLLARLEERGVMAQREVLRAALVAIVEGVEVGGRGPGLAAGVSRLTR